MRRPTFDIEVDTLAADVLKDPHPAVSTLLRGIDARQHALMTAWGAPYRCFVVDEWEGAGTYNMGIRVPPGVSACQIGVYASGEGYVTFTTDSDSTGTVLGFSTDDDDDDLGQWVFSDVSTSSTTPNRALILREPGAWHYSDGEFGSDLTTTAVLTDSAGAYGSPAIWMVAIRWLHVETASTDWVESHYLQFDGSTQRGDSAAFSGGAGVCAVAFKLASWTDGGQSWGGTGSLKESGGTTQYKVKIQRNSSSTTQHYISHYDTSQVKIGSSDVVTHSSVTIVRSGVIAGHHNGDTDYGWTQAADGVLDQQSETTTTAATLGTSAVLSWGHIWGQYGDAQIISACVLSAVPTGNQVAAYSVHGVSPADAFDSADVVEYWLAADASNNGTDFGVDGKLQGASSRITFTNMDATDLVKM